ncbi:MAG: hypothetical protein GEV08_17650 [Acidimicrobiia bacterium]|nr:hypothetical protein [Acidimicrobiia bacterium]
MKRKKKADAGAVPDQAAAVGPQSGAVGPQAGTATRTAAPPSAVVAAALARVPTNEGASVRFGLSLLVALAATLPAFVNVMSGRTALAAAAARFLAALAVAWVGSAVVSNLFARRSNGAPGDLSVAGAPADLVPGDAPGAR